MGWLSNLFGRGNKPKKKNIKKSAVEPTFAEEESSEGEKTVQHYFFICSANASLIDAYHKTFSRAAAEDPKRKMILEDPVRYSSLRGDLDVRAKEAAAELMPFNGELFLGTKSSTVKYIDECLLGLKVAAFKEIHVSSITTKQTGAAWVHHVYEELMRQAVTQGILPFEMIETTDKKTAHFLRDSFIKVE